MKALSLWQPWAILVCLGSKRIETRSWATKYRGPLLIHASARKNRSEINAIMSWDETDAAMHALDGSHYWEEKLAFGGIIGQVNLIDCRPTNDYTHRELAVSRTSPKGRTWLEQTFGDFTSGRYGWLLDKPVLFDRMIPYKGSMGLFEVQPEVIQHARPYDL